MQLETEAIAPEIEAILDPLSAVNCAECLIDIVRKRLLEVLESPPQNPNTKRQAASYIVIPVLGAVSQAVSRTVKSNFLEYLENQKDGKKTSINENTRR